MEKPQDIEFRLELAKRFVDLTREEMETSKRRWLAALDELDRAEKLAHAARREQPMYVPV